MDIGCDLLQLYADLIPTEMMRLRELEPENALLKKIVVDLSVGKEMLQDVVKRSSEAC